MNTQSLLRKPSLLFSISRTTIFGVRTAQAAAPASVLLSQRLQRVFNGHAS